MHRSIQPLQFLLTLLAGWINHRQLKAIEYLKAENRLRTPTPDLPPVANID